MRFTHATASQETPCPRDPTPDNPDDLSLATPDRAPSGVALHPGARRVLPTRNVTRLRWVVAGDIGSRAAGLVSRATRLVGTVRELSSRPSVRPWLLLIAAAAFAVLAFVSFRSLPEDGSSPRPLVMVPYVLLLTPTTLALNALEYQSMARALGHRIGFRSAARVGVTASLANYLPAPGGVMVRTAALKGKGSSIGSAVSINAVAGLMWLGLASVATGVALLLTGSLPQRGALALVLGMLCLAASALWIRRSGSGWRRTFGHLLWVEAGIVVVAGCRVWVALVAIGQTAAIGAAVAISSSTVIAAAVGIFPAGLGLREAISGGLAVAVEVPAATAMAAMAVDRVAGQLGMALCTPFVGLGRRRRASEEESDLADRPTTETEGAVSAG